MYIVAQSKHYIIAVSRVRALVETPDFFLIYWGKQTVHIHVNKRTA